jgi:hypothetical protein
MFASPAQLAKFQLPVRLHAHHVQLDSEESRMHVSAVLLALFLLLHLTTAQVSPFFVMMSSI